MKTVEEIAIDARKEMVEVSGFWVSDLVARKLCTLFLDRIDAERGKDAVAKVTVHYNYGPDYKASVEWLTDCRFSPDTMLFIAPQPPAPCPKCAESEKTLQSIAEHVDWAFIGDLDDVVASRINERNAAIAHFAADRDALQAKVADLTREVAQWKNNHATVVRQARVLKERTDMPLERVKAYEHYGEMIERVEQQAALIEKCERCLEDLSGMGWAEEALAAIAAHKS